MTPFLALPGGAQAELLYSLSGKNVENRLWFLIDSPPATPSDLQALADGLSSWWASHIVPLLSVDLLFVLCVATDWSSFGAPFYIGSTTSVFGGNPTKSYSANVSVAVPFRWPLQYGRLKRNKHYLPGIPDDVVVGNDVVFTFQDALFEAYVALIDDAPFFNPPNRWRWAVASSYDAGALRSELLARHCIGPPRPLLNSPYTYYKVAQRRRRLPV